MRNRILFVFLILAITSVFGRYQIDRRSVSDFGNPSSQFLYPGFEGEEQRKIRVGVKKQLDSFLGPKNVIN